MLKNKLFILSLFISLFNFSYAIEEHEVSPQISSRSSQIAENTELNVKWLNAELNPNQFCLFGTQEAAEKQFTILLEWATKNPTLHSINCWYNSQTTSPQALENTQNTLKNKLKEKNCQKDITFKDMWEIDYIKNHPTAFHCSHPVYFIADLVRMAILLRFKGETDQNHSEFIPRYTFYSDLNIPTASLDSMFTDKTKKRSIAGPLLSEILDSYGFALSKNDAGDINYAYENAFIVLDSSHAVAYQSLQFAVLDLNRRRAELFFMDKYWEKLSAQEVKNKCQLVFMSFVPMMSYYKYLTGDYGINDDQRKMPPVLQARINHYKNPLALFSSDSTRPTVTFKYGKDVLELKYVGYQLANKEHSTGVMVNRDGYIKGVERILYLPSPTTLREVTIQVNKPISSFY